MSCRWAETADKRTRRDDWPIDRPTDRLTDRPIDRPTDRPTDRQADRTTGRPTDRSIDRACNELDHEHFIVSNQRTNWKMLRQSCRRNRRRWECDRGRPLHRPVSRPSPPSAPPNRRPTVFRFPVGPTRRRRSTSSSDVRSKTEVPRRQSDVQ